MVMRHHASIVTLPQMTLFEAEVISIQNTLAMWVEILKRHVPNGNCGCDAKIDFGTEQNEHFRDYQDYGNL